MDSLIREINGKEEVWYSELYLNKRIKDAYEYGYQKGIRIEIHKVQDLINIEPKTIKE